jgi:hypothetical protein
VVLATTIPVGAPVDSALEPALESGAVR